VAAGAGGGAGRRASSRGLYAARANWQVVRGRRPRQRLERSEDVLLVTHFFQELVGMAARWPILVFGIATGVSFALVINPRPTSEPGSPRRVFFCGCWRVRSPGRRGAMQPRGSSRRGRSCGTTREERHYLVGEFSLRQPRGVQPITSSSRESRAGIEPCMIFQIRRHSVNINYFSWHGERLS
jgi:hypothetical protein